MSKEFMYCHPNVMVVKDKYDIIVNVDEEGVCYVKIGRVKYYENDTGIMPSVTKVHKIRVPQKMLDKYKSYTVYFKRVYERKNNWPEVGRWMKKTYAFKPIEKTDDINLFYSADIHARWDEAEKTATYFGDDLDLYIVNGDFGESSSYENLRNLNRLIGNVTKGEIPSLVGRGNHDTRGLLAEKVTDYMATYEGKSYFDFSVGPISGVILDCGEDKYDNHAEYSGLNFFELYRKNELKFLKKLKLKDGAFKFAVCHVPFMSKVAMSGQFDIMPDLFKKWTDEINRVGVEFMICGHVHRTYYLANGDERDKCEHNFPVICASALFPDKMVGTAVTLKKSGTIMKHVNSFGQVEGILSVKDGYQK